MTYLDSLRATRAMDGVAVVHPGHGDDVTDHVALIDERLAMHERRAAKLAGLIAERARAPPTSWRRRCGATSPSRRPTWP